MNRPSWLKTIKKTSLWLILYAVVLASCKHDSPGVGQLEIAKSYYSALDRSDQKTVSKLLADSLLTSESGYNYQQTFSKAAYAEWVRWDSVFEPTYKVLKIEQEAHGIRARISKTDKRIAFLHKAPIVTEQLIRFSDNRISSIETTSYLGFNDSVFVKNRDMLVRWIDQHHPELNGFLYDQTKTGGLNYLRAIELYRTRK